MKALIVLGVLAAMVLLAVLWREFDDWRDLRVARRNAQAILDASREYDVMAAQRLAESQKQATRFDMWFSDRAT